MEGEPAGQLFWTNLGSACPYECRFSVRRGGRAWRRLSHTDIDGQSLRPLTYGPPLPPACPQDLQEALSRADATAADAAVRVERQLMLAQDDHR